MTLEIKRKLKNPTRCGLYVEPQRDGSEKLVAWARSPAMGVSERFRPEDAGDAAAWLEEMAPGIEPLVVVNPK